MNGITKKEFPILEFDGSRDVKIDPRKIIEPVESMPECCVLCFFSEAIEEMIKNYPYEIISYFASVDKNKHYIYKIDFNGIPIALHQALLGGPLAAGQIDELVAKGCKKILAIGSAGALDENISRGKLILPTSALRDDGVSYHYVEPSRWIDVNERVVDIIEKYLIKNKIPYVKGKTWTTDAFFRETNNKFDLRKSEGCISVDMECAGYLASAKYNNIDFGQIFYSADCLGGEEWQKREWKGCTKEERRYWMLEHAMKIVQAI